MALHSLNHDFIVHETLVLVLRLLDFPLSYTFILYYLIELYSTLVKVFRSKTYFIVPVNCEWVKNERFEVVQILQLKVRTSHARDQHDDTVVQLLVESYRIFLDTIYHK